MPKLCLGPNPNPTPPRFALPEGVTDCHIHLFPADDAYPYVADRDYTPAPADAAALRSLYDTLGIARFVAVQPSVYGQDNRAQLSRAAAVGCRSGRSWCWSQVRRIAKCRRCTTRARAASAIS